MLGGVWWEREAGSRGGGSRQVFRGMTMLARCEALPGTVRRGMAVDAANGEECLLRDCSDLQRCLQGGTCGEGPCFAVGRGGDVGQGQEVDARFRKALQTRPPRKLAVSMGRGLRAPCQSRRPRRPCQARARLASPATQATALCAGHGCGTWIRARRARTSRDEQPFATPPPRSLAQRAASVGLLPGSSGLPLPPCACP